MNGLKERLFSTSAAVVRVQNGLKERLFSTSAAVVRMHDNPGSRIVAGCEPKKDI